MPYFFLMLRRNHWQHYRHLLRRIEIRHAFQRAALYLITVFTLHCVAMAHFEGMALEDAIWLTLTTVMTVGYGDYAAETLPGRLATVLLIYVGSVFVLFNLAGDYLQYRAERKLAMLRGRWKWDMENHIVILNSPSINRTCFIVQLVDELRRGRSCAECPVLLLSEDYPDGLPEAFQERGVVYYHGDPTDPDALLAADAQRAAILVALAENVEQHRSDELTFDVLTRLREFEAKGRIIAECVRKSNRERLRRAGAEIVLRPIRFYPEIIVRAIECPGTEVILENLFTIEGDECIGIRVERREAVWADVVVALMMDRLGTAIAYADGEGRVHTNPPPDAVVDLVSVFLIAKHEREIMPRLVEAALARPVPSAPRAA